MSGAAPSISVVVPTLNAAKYLDECLGSVRAQDYPQDLVEVLVVDGGSTDATVEIARRHGARVLANPLRTGESGKAVGVRAATGDLVLMVDSDNVLVGDDWLRRMVRPLEDPEVISSEALRWEYRRRDHYINRYQALTGINDPLALFVGNYDRLSTLTGRWTDYPVQEEPRDGWLRVTLDPRWVPTMGANGYLVRRSAFEEVPVGDYLFDIDFVHDLVQRGHATIARVDVPIRHYFCDGVRRFYLKTRRRTDDYFYFAAQGRRSYPWTDRQRGGVVRFVASTVTVVPLLVQVSRGLRRRRDPAWLFHVPACWITLAVYGTGTIRGKLRPRLLDRSDWRQ
ncbi:MAG: glycosyltransferase family 2 protein [Pseudomonadota bacterium]